MKAVMVMFDSLNRNYLPGYGTDCENLPQFSRLKQHTAVFENHYAGSLPCMPARRELHTGRYNFLHREWGPLEPFDESMPELLKNAGIYTHLISDHCHYWEDGGATYHSRYSSWENIRGQEGDTWAPAIGIQDTQSYLTPAQPGTPPYHGRLHHCANLKQIQEENIFPQEKTFRQGLEFILHNQDKDNWFLQIETFDPHEPFDAPERFQDLCCESGDPPYNWPVYGSAEYPEPVIRALRNHYRALLHLCDECLGKVLDLFDRYDLWKDTMLIVTTDHDFLLGERSWWGKNLMPLYNEVVHIPLYIWDPRSSICNERRCALTQTIDLAPTLLEYFSVPVPVSVQGKDLANTIQTDQPVRSYALYGNFGGHINITDGEWQYMRAPVSKDNTPLNCYTLMPTNLMGRFSTEILKNAELSEPFSFTKGCRLLKYPVSDFFNSVMPKSEFGNILLRFDPEHNNQEETDDPEKENELISAMRKLMQENDAPPEQYERVGL